MAAGGEAGIRTRDAIVTGWQFATSLHLQKLPVGVAPTSRMLCRHRPIYSGSRQQIIQSAQGALTPFMFMTALQIFIESVITAVGAYRLQVIFRHPVKASWTMSPSKQVFKRHRSVDVFLLYK